MKSKTVGIIVQILPILLMIGLIPFILNDYYLSLVYLAIIGISFGIYLEKNDFLIFIFGLIGMTISEYFFISTGVETFVRNSLFGLMPLWLPILWAYSFVAIKRSVRILEK